MSENSLVSLLDGGARLAPDKTAVWTAEAGLTFAELMAGARRIGTALRASGVERGDRVAVWMDKTPACVQALIGIMAAGAAYVPLDPRAPWRRSRAIVEDCGIAALAVDRPRLPNLGHLAGSLPLKLVIVDGEPGGTPELPVRTLADILAAPAGDLPDPGPDDLAYILYTSGSTGTPKGVVHTHRSGLAFVEWVRRTYGITADDVFSSHAPFHFDLSISDLYASLGSGASVRLISSIEAMLPPFLVKGVAEWGITVWYSVPSVLTAMLEVGELEERGFGRVHTLLFAGEVFPTPQLRRLRRALPDVRLSNLFGPTETNVCTYYDVPDEVPPGRSIPIGKVCEHLEGLVLDDEGHEVADGEEGTLWIKGGNLLSGYWNDPERTAATLRPDPRGGDGLAYCTGDRVRLQDDGNFEFLGRRDHMIKVRGYRIEAGEVEAALASHPDVVEAVVVPIPDEKTGNRLAASVVPRAGRSVGAGELRSFCAEQLPGYMVPEHVEVVPTLPRTSTGKADRQTILATWREKDGQ